MRSSHSSSRNRRGPQRLSGSISVWQQAGRELKRGPMLVVCAFVASCLILGGGPGEANINFWIIAVSGFALLTTAVMRGWLEVFQQLPLFARLAAALSVALPFLQLIPLPPGIWHALPGQQMRIDILASFALDQGWMPLSITPVQTAYSAVMALAMFGIFVASLALTPLQTRMLLWWVTIILLVAVVIGIVQFASNGASFNFYRIAHRGSLIGFFANKNHMGLMVACLIPLLYVLNEDRLAGSGGAFGLVVVSWVLLLSLAVATNSRAGLGLTVLGILLVALRRFPARRRAVLLAGGGALAALGAAVAAVPAIGDLFDRVGDAKEDLRVNLVDQAMPLVGQYGALGSGLGSFAEVYAPTEKLEWVTPQYVNHVHNDFVQLVIEAGIPGVIIALLWVAALAYAGLNLKRQKVSRFGGSDDLAAFAWLGLVISGMFAAHSLVDYPGRRIAALVVLVIALGQVFRLQLPRVSLAREGGPERRPGLDRRAAAVIDNDL